MQIESFVKRWSRLPAAWIPTAWQGRGGHRRGGWSDERRTKGCALQTRDYEKMARSMAHALKTADGIYRLVEFAAGRSDSRPDTATDWLRGLTNEQLHIVEGWVTENVRRADAAERQTAPTDRSQLRRDI